MYVPTQLLGGQADNEDSFKWNPCHSPHHSLLHTVHFHDSPGYCGHLNLQTLFCGNCVLLRHAYMGRASMCVHTHRYMHRDMGQVTLLVFKAVMKKTWWKGGWSLRGLHILWKRPCFVFCLSVSGLWGWEVHRLAAKL